MINLNVVGRRINCSSDVQKRKFALYQVVRTLRNQHGIYVVVVRYRQEIYDYFKNG